MYTTQINQFFLLVCKMAPYLLLGFLLAGLMHAFIPGRFYTRYLSKANFRSVLNAAILGIPLPLCSCGVIPTAMSLRKEGASKGAVVSFLIATPQTGIDSILATYGLMGLPFAIIRPIVALMTALMGGVAAKGETADEHNTHDDSAQCCTDSQTKPLTFMQKMAEALRYGYVTMMQDIGKWLVVGLAVAAVITIGVPEEWFSAFHGNTWASMILVLCIAVPMYVCATGSIPIAVALMLKGLTPGAALVLLMAGPACNVASILVVRKVLGNRTLVIYLLSIIAGSVLFGCIVDMLHFNGAVDFLGGLSCCHEAHCEDVSWLGAVSSVVLFGLLANALVVKHPEHNNEKKETNINKNSVMRKFRIEGMNCNHCRMSAEKALLSVEGVTSATVSLQEKEACVEGEATDATICKAVEEVGFTCTAL